MSDLDLNGAIDLSPKPRVRVGGQIAGIARKMDEHGTFEALGVPGPNGQMSAVPSRESFLDAQELIDEVVDACRHMVREELAAFYGRMRKLEEIAKP